MSDTEENRENEPNTEPPELKVAGNDEAPKKETRAEKKEAKKAAKIEQTIAEQYEDLKSAHLYLKAEFDNYKKNMIKERSQLVKFGSERIIHEVLNVVDNFSRALDMEVTAENFESFKEGISMTADSFQKTLENFGVEELKVNSETIFDPNLHEALSSEPTDKIKAGYVSSVFKKGYKLHGKVIRAAQVIVAREPDPIPTESETAKGELIDGALEIDDTTDTPENA